MSEARVTLRALIEELTRTEEVPESFVRSVVALLAQKGIELDGDAGPWADILVRSFKSRAETHRVCTAMTTAVNEMKEDLERLRVHFVQLAERAVKSQARITALAEASRVREPVRDTHEKKEPRWFPIFAGAKLLPN